MTWESMMVISGLFAHDDWKEITIALQKKYEVECSIILFMADKALWRMEDGRMLKDLGVNGK